MVFIFPAAVLGLYIVMPVGIFAAETNHGRRMCRERKRNMRENRFRRHVQDAREAVLVTDLDIFTAAPDRKEFLNQRATLYEPHSTVYKTIHYTEPESIAASAAPSLVSSSTTTPASSSAPSRRSTGESTKSSSFDPLTSLITPFSLPAFIPSEKKSQIPKIRINTGSVEMEADDWERWLRTVDSAIDVRTPSSIGAQPEWTRCRRESLSNAFEVGDGDGLVW